MLESLSVFLTRTQRRNPRKNADHPYESCKNILRAGPAEMPLENWYNCQGVLFFYLQTYIRGLVGLRAGERFYFSLQIFFVQRTHVLVQILVNFGRKLKGDVRRIRIKIKQSNTESIQKGAATIFADLRMNLSRTVK